MTNNSNMWRTIIGIVLGILLIYGAKTIADRIVANKKKPKTKVEHKINQVFTDTIANSEIPVVIKEKGNLNALRKVEFFAEVQGILKSSTRLFKPGQSYSAGNIIFSIDDAEFKASLVAQKSVLYNLIAQIMPDLKLDYPSVFAKWNQYLSNFDIQQIVPNLPEFTTDKEKYFINSKNIVTTFYNIKNLEEKHKKYRIYAPFYGIVTESNVTPGALIRPGQKLGTMLSPSVYEVAISVNESLKDFISIGKEVKIFTLDGNETWTGKIARIDATINAATQGIQAYVEVRGKHLKEGMFVEAEITGKSISNAVEIDRNLLIDNNHIYTVVDGKLKTQIVQVDYLKEKSAVVTNLTDGTVILSRAIPGAYDGMLVEVAPSTKDIN